MGLEPRPFQIHGEPSTFWAIQFGVTNLLRHITRSSNKSIIKKKGVHSPRKNHHQQINYQITHTIQIIKNASENYLFTTTQSLFEAV